MTMGTADAWRDKCLAVISSVEDLAEDLRMVALGDCPEITALRAAVTRKIAEIREEKSRFT